MPNRSSRRDRWGGIMVGGVALAIGLVATLVTSSSAFAPPIRICADPNNLPFSNRAGEGFENHLAAIVGKELNRRVEYTWWAQRRGFFRNTINAGLCDVVAGVPASID